MTTNFCFTFFDFMRSQFITSLVLDIRIKMAGVDRWQNMIDNRMIVIVFETTEDKIKNFK